ANLDYLIALNAIDGLGPARIQKLISHFGDPQRIFKANDSELAFCVFLPAQVRANIRNFPVDDFLKKEYALIKKHGVCVISSSDKVYSDQLKEISDPPAVLYCKGNLELLQQPAVGVVGCRRASIYGMAMAEKFAQELSDRGVVVVSGLARGIDTAAHRGTLRAKGNTIAVLGSGLANVYPPENKKLFETIAEQGLAISEFSMSELPKPGNFPSRNRIISGLSLGIIVVEAARRSGALITADLALEQGREVFAVPGKIDSASAQGVNELIKQGAKLVSCIEDVVEELQLPQALSIKNKEMPVEKKDIVQDKSFSEDEITIMKLLSARAVDIDAICQQCGLPIPSVSGILLNLELKGLIKQLPGKLFVLR
ncbi:MAG: DNA-processing protein DprA, partial [Candidatus Omnitrophica bacterium]|nr:DNA-processing protein DprA [Candidatus Omnitrophota bacterium]